MELLDVTLTRIQRRNRAAFVRRADIPGAPALSPGHKVVLRDESGDYFAGTVVDLQAFQGEERYLVHVGVRLPEEYAMMRLGRLHPSGVTRDEYDSVLDMLGEARDVLARMPAQRGSV